MKKYPLFVVLSFLTLFITNLYSQPWQYLGIPSGRPANDVIFSESGRIICSNDLSIYYSDEDGLNWNESVSSKKFAPIYRLTPRVNGEIIAITKFNIIKSTDDGVNWFVISNQSYLNDYGVKILESPIDSSLYFNKGNSLFKSTDGG